MKRTKFLNFSEEYEILIFSTAYLLNSVSFNELICTNKFKKHLYCSHVKDFLEITKF